MAYLNQLSPIASSLGSFQLDGTYTSLEDMPNSLRKLIKRSNKIILVRESSYQASIQSGGGRTTGTMWYKGNVLGFTVEDAIRDKKIQDVTAIPDTVKDPTKLSSIKPGAYNLVLGTTPSNFIGKTYYRNKQGSLNVLTIGSLSDPNGVTIWTKDVNAPENFINSNYGDYRDRIAFTGAMVHHGGSETASSGCIIFGTKRKDNGTLNSNPKEVQALNKYLQEQGVVGKGKLNNLVIIDIRKVPKDIPNLLGEVIDAETGRPVPGTEVKIDPLPVLPAEELTSQGIQKINERIPNVPSQEELKGKGKAKLDKLTRKKLKNPLSSDQLQAFASNILNFIKS